MSGLTACPRQHRLGVLLALSCASLCAFVILSQPLLADAGDQGTIAYVQLSTHDIHLVSPDGTGDRVLWTAPRAFFVDPPYELAWRPDGRELAFTSDHEAWASWYASDVYAVGSDGTGYRRITNAPAAAEPVSAASPTPLPCRGPPGPARRKGRGPGCIWRPRARSPG